MEIRTILVNLDIDNYAPNLLKIAVDLAQRFDAKICAVAASEAALSLVGAEGGTIATRLYEADRAAIEERLTSLEVEFKETVPPAMRDTFLAILDMPSRALVGAARRADLIVVGSPASEDNSPARRVDIGALLTSAGRPVLIAASEASTVKADAIVVGWKDTREARRAIADALPFLKLANDVVVAAIHEGNRSAEKKDIEDVVAWMKRHGVRAHGEVYSPTGTQTASLERIARDFKADLIVTGAYSHGRMRERLFGGVTQDLIASTTVNRFMSN